MENEINIKEEIRAILRYYDKRLDDCTMSEAKSFYRMLVENSELNGSIKDFAEFYGVSETSVKATISRKLFAKPIRCVLYPFHKFRLIRPSRWKVK